jgi:hypothetical protein
LTQDQLVDRLAFWQRVLRLQDWDVSVSIVRRHDLRCESALAEGTISQYRRAQLRVLDPADWGPREWPIERDMEASLLHELIHLHLHDLRVAEKRADGSDTPEWTALERCAESVARALLTVERGTA